MSVLTSIFDRAKQNPRTIVLPEWKDERMIRAAAQAVDMAIAKPVFVGNADTIRQAIVQSGVSANGLEFLDIANKKEEYAQVLIEKFLPKIDLKDEQLEVLLGDSLYLAALLLDAGEVDAMVAGIQRSTADVVRAALKVVGLAAGSKTASSFFVMSFRAPDQPLHMDCIMGDCALVVEPSAEQMADIAIASADNASVFLGCAPRVAMLSFSTEGSAQHPHVEKVQKATNIVRSVRPDIAIVGEVQMDAALLPSVAKVKMRSQSIELPANVFIFPDLNAGNIGYKICQRLAGADVIGPVLQGFRKPVNDLSRGSSIDDIVSVMALTSLQVS